MPKLVDVMDEVDDLRAMKHLSMALSSALALRITMVLSRSISESEGALSNICRRLEGRRGREAEWESGSTSRREKD
jgi:hypothetical protein